MSWEKFWPFSKNDEIVTDKNKVFATGKITQLRQKKVDDAINDYNWRLDSELSDLDATKPINLTYDEFLRYHKEDVKFPNYNSFRMAIDTHDGKHIGNCMFYDINSKTLQAEFGIMIGNKDYWNNFTNNLINSPYSYGASNKEKKKYLVEFVSANPTGPLHVGHCRGCLLYTSPSPRDRG